MSRVLVIGDLEIARITCATLTVRGTEVVHLLEPTDAQLHDALSAPADAVAVLVRGDVSVLRYALLVEHLQPLVRLVATVFDRTLAAELTRAVRNSQITSPADVCVPSMVARCLGNDVLAVIDRAGQPTDVVDVHGELRTHAHAGRHSRPHQLSRRLASQLRPYDSATRILFAGAAGLLLMIALDWIVSASALHETAPAALYSATRIVATVGPAAAQTAPNWYLVFSSLCMLTTIGLIAIFTAGIVNRLLSDRSIALVGRRTRPRHDHIVVVGLGQVGLRLAIRLRQLHVPVLVVEQDPHAANLRLAKAAGIPVYIGHAEDTRVLRAVRLHRARSLVCLASDELDNIEVAIAALSLVPELRVVLRAGENEVIAETRSLFRIGEVCNVSALTAAAALLSLDGQPYSAVFTSRGKVTAFGPSTVIVLETRCSCVLHREAGSPGQAAGVAGRPT